MASTMTYSRALRNKKQTGRTDCCHRTEDEDVTLVCGLSASYRQRK